MLENRILKTLKARRQKQEAQKGASMIEYALIIAGVAVVAAILFGGEGGGTVGNAISDKVQDAVDTIDSNPATPPSDG
ncbi:pilus assembly protein Flp/PilA [uncultured Thiomicrorhabdus sp.]